MNEDFIVQDIRIYGSSWNENGEVRSFDIKADVLINKGGIYYKETYIIPYNVYCKPCEAGELVYAEIDDDLSIFNPKKIIDHVKNDIRMRRKDW